MRKRTESDVNETKRKKGTTKQVKHNAKKKTAIKSYGRI